MPTKVKTDLFSPPRYVNTLLKLVPQVLQLQEQLREAVQNGDMETSHGICRIAVALGENHSRYAQLNATKTVHDMVDCRHD